MSSKDWFIKVIISDDDSVADRENNPVTVGEAMSSLKG